MRGIRRIVLGRDFGVNDFDTTAAIKLPPTYGGTEAHDALSSESSTANLFSYRSFWAKNTSDARVEIGKVGVLQGPASSIGPKGNFRVSLAQSNNTTKSLKFEIDGDGNGTVYNGDMEVTGNGKGFICTSPDGLIRKRIGIDNSGNISITNT